MHQVSILRMFLRAPPSLREAMARAVGNFWLPCPLCGTHFAGFECLSNASVKTSEEGLRKMVCPFCIRKAREMEKEEVPE